MNHPVSHRSFPKDPSSILTPLSSFTAPFWDGLVAGRFELPKCASCGRLTFPPRPICSHCGSGDFDWQECSGRGTVFSWVRYHRPYMPEFADLVPYCVATVELVEDCRLFARLTDFDRDPKIGEPVELVIERWPGGQCVPVFRRTSQLSPAVDGPQCIRGKTI